MWRFVLVAWFLSACTLESAAQLVFPVNSWREYLPSRTTIEVAHTTDAVWAATPYSVIRYDVPSGEIERKSKVNGLSGSAVSTIGADAHSDKIVIAYDDSNIDIIHKENIFRIDEIVKSNIPADKKINHILISNQVAYLSAGLGIIVLDLVKMEVKDTYIIGNSGNYTEVFRTAITTTHLIAASSEGLKQIPLSSSNPSDFSNWKFAVPSSSDIESVVAFDNTIIFRQHDSLFRLQNGVSSHFYSDGWHIRNQSVSGNKLLISQSRGPDARVIELSTSGNVTNTFESSAFIQKPEDILFFQNKYWIADSISGFSFAEGNRFTSLSPDAPADVALTKSAFLNNALWTTAGGVTENWQPLKKPAGLFSLINNTWTNYTSISVNGMDSIHDIISVAIDPSNGSVWAASFGDGLLHIRSVNELTHYKQNSPLEASVLAPGSYRVAGVAFDQDRNLWISNYGAINNLHVKRPNGDWMKFSIPFQLTDNAVAEIMIDDYNQKWIIAPKNGLIVFNHGQLLEGMGDDRYKFLRSGIGNGNLPDNQVLSIAKDKNGLIWIGTAKGIGIIPCAGEILSNAGCEAILPVVQQDNFPGYLFKEERVQAIAIDGADRKWIGTRNGVWLISADGEKTIHRFTQQNSPLPDNDIRSITINGVTGEVFFGTKSGIYSFRGTATESREAPEDILVFPNPVPPGYKGAIAIRGKLNNSTVKIVETNGKLVYEARAFGGQAIWDGKDYRGRVIASGVYLVLLTDESGKEKLAGKIVFLRK